ncbi:hypothetical protein BSNK01_01160 [Bacillaceae bacterium]
MEKEHMTNFCFRSLTYWYQPIYLLNTWEIYAHEALLRSLPPGRFTPEEILAHCGKNGQLPLLDRQTIVHTRTHPGRKLLFVNMHPHTFLLPDFLQWLDKQNLKAQKIVFELIHWEKVKNPESLYSVIGSLRSRGFKISLDNFHMNELCLRYWAKIKPDFVKMASDYAAGLAKNGYKQKTLEFLHDLFADRSTQLIVKGLETAEDLAMAKFLGVQLGQGYILGKPLPARSQTYPLKDQMHRFTVLLPAKS